MDQGQNQPDLDFTFGSSEELARWRASVHPEKSCQPQNLDFASGSDGLSVWRQEQTIKLTETARREGLPIGENVRIILQNDLELSGRLLLNAETHELRIGLANFPKAEIVSCVIL